MGIFKLELSDKKAMMMMDMCMVNMCKFYNTKNSNVLSIT